MGLQIRRAPSKKVQVLITLVAGVAVVAQPAAMILQTVKASALSLAPDTSNVKFKGSPKYVRENNPGDIAAQLMTYSTTTHVNFYINGDVDTPIPGVREGVAGPVYDEWRLKVPLAAGEYSVTAQVKIGGEWYAASGSGKTYSIDAPWASYIAPTDQNYFFRPGDNPVRLKVDDEFSQFKDAKFELHHYNVASGTFGGLVGNFIVTRSQCDQRAAGQYLLCDVSKSDNWEKLADGAYAVKLMTRTQANNGARTNEQQYWSRSFVIDSVPPSITNFGIEGSTTVGGDLLKVAAAVADNNFAESVRFYTTTLRGDGVCTGNETKLTELRVFSSGAANAEYQAMLDISGLESGTYCVVAVARDDAMNNSNSVRLIFHVDHTAPTVTIRSTGSASPMASVDSISLAGRVEGEFKALTLIKDGIAVAAKIDMSSGEWSYTLPKSSVVEGVYNFTVVAEDTYGNRSAEASLAVNVGPYVPGQSAITPNNLASPSAPGVITPRAIAGTTAPFTAAQAQKDSDDTDVLGTEIAKGTAHPDDLPAVAATEDGWKVFGIAWYWWALIAAVLTSGIWWTAASVRRRKVAELA